MRSRMPIERCLTRQKPELDKAAVAFLTLLKVASLVLHINKLLHLHTASKSTNKNSEIVKFQSTSNKIRVKTRSTER